jgi:DNA topoisomerase-1
MRVAQELYEGLEIGKEGTVGLITYLRTDSTRIASVAQAEALEFIRKEYGPDYAPGAPNEYKSKKSAQDAHEAIRPTSVLRTPDNIKEYLSRDQYRLYKLIWERFVASQMSPAVYDTISVDIAAGDYLFRSNSSQIKFTGYKRIYNDNEDEEGKYFIPPLQVKKRLACSGSFPSSIYPAASPLHRSQPGQAAGGKTIGRPSTYAPIIETILKRHYVERQNKQFIPTELGQIVVDLLIENFGDILDVEFTAKMEAQLDMVEEGELNWKTVLRDFYPPFQADLDKAREVVEKIEIKDEDAGKPCPQCGQPMVIKYGRFGKFIACSAFPECRYTESLNEEAGVNCPLCGGAVIMLKSKKGRKYFGCKNYPECSFRSWNKPTGERCPRCGEAMVEKNSKGHPGAVCQNQDCKYQPDAGAEGLAAVESPAP